MFVAVTANALRFDLDQPWPDGVHAEIHDTSARRFACVRVETACVEVESGDWLLVDGEGNLYPVPAAFLQPSVERL